MRTAVAVFSGEGGSGKHHRGRTSYATGRVSDFLWLLCIPMDGDERSEMRRSRINGSVAKYQAAVHLGVRHRRYAFDSREVMSRRNVVPVRLQHCSRRGRSIGANYPRIDFRIRIEPIFEIRWHETLVIPGQSSRGLSRNTPVSVPIAGRVLETYSVVGLEYREHVCTAHHWSHINYRKSHKAPTLAIAPTIHQNLQFSRS